MTICIHIVENLSFPPQDIRLPSGSAMGSQGRKGESPVGWVMMGIQTTAGVEASGGARPAPIVTVETGAMRGYISHSIAHCAAHSLHAPLPCPAYPHSHYLRVTGLVLGDILCL